MWHVRRKLLVIIILIYLTDYLISLKKICNDSPRENRYGLKRKVKPSDTSAEERLSPQIISNLFDISGFAVKYKNAAESEEKVHSREKFVGESLQGTTTHKENIESSDRPGGDGEGRSRRGGLPKNNKSHKARKLPRESFKYAEDEEDRFSEAPGYHRGDHPQSAKRTVRNKKKKTTRH
ncbi:hypothetical protein NPIL_659321 [Nephila pilipes]|uniref:Uncharacterized protein n=1 Tax=Nephila pilipes TaxID=299642 RepID=A0A8X6QYE9_NEPPI|nr:hypothetical protein NPIL_19161 [Nephila pilipes]GFU46030.1 hypothetical protein NPIL_659321 [Nephila pilipes]